MAEKTTFCKMAEAYEKTRNLGGANEDQDGTPAPKLTEFTVSHLPRGVR